ncbi:MAG: pyrimidine dimer DNA glycosylase/endonuclease V [Bacteroidales bacterium]
MQTFLPYPDFQKSAKILDKRRVWKQVVEAKQILDVLLSKKQRGAWVNHPATRMWRGYEGALIKYYNIFYIECLIYRNIRIKKLKIKIPHNVVYPPWLGDERVHSSHRGRLLNKYPEYYSQFGWNEEPIPQNQGYFWPVDMQHCLV